MKISDLNPHAFSSCALAFLLVACGASQPPVATPGAMPHWQTTHSAFEACGGSRIDQAQCDALIENTGAHRTYGGWGAKDLESAYKVPVGKGQGQSVFVVDAYDNPDVASDLATYRATMGLPNGKFHKYSQDGKKHYPPGSPGWGVEIDLDVEMASASCPKCTIDLVEANTNSWSDIETAEAEAVKLGATIISNSYSGSGADESYYDTKGVAYLASAGDEGYGVYQPAAFPRVIAVGGTVLTKGGKGRGFSEVVWSDTGGGCSDSGKSKPKWQHDPDCKSRTANDVAAVAVGAAEYDTYSEGGWIEVDGTSISSPFVAGMVALAGNATKQDGGKMLWSLSKSQWRKYLYDVPEGHDGSGDTYLTNCSDKWLERYCGPVGWGTPHGVGAL